MTDFTSSIQQIPYDADRVYASLSDLNNLSKVQSNIPEGAISELTFTSDTCSFNVPNIGTIALRIVEREPAKTVKLVTEKSPVPFTCWIQLAQAAPEDTRLKLTLRADIPFMLKGMVSKPLENMVQKVAEALAALPY